MGALEQPLQKSSLHQATMVGVVLETQMMVAQAVVVEGVEHHSQSVQPLQPECSEKNQR